jgi:hypothetical protein
LKSESAFIICSPKPNNNPRSLLEDASHLGDLVIPLLHFVLVDTDGIDP